MNPPKRLGSAAWFGVGRVRPGPLTRVPAGCKLAGLALLSCLTVWVTGIVWAVVWFGFGVGLALVAGVGLRGIIRVLRGFAFIAAGLFLVHVFTDGPVRGAEIVARLVALIFAASAVTASTALGELLDVVARMLRRVPGVDEERVALAFALFVRTIPAVADLASQTRQAAWARGIGRSPRAFLVPFAVRTVGHALRTGEALAARGIAE